MLQSAKQDALVWAVAGPDLRIVKADVKAYLTSTVDALVYAVERAQRITNSELAAHVSLHHFHATNSEQFLLFQMPFSIPAFVSTHIL